MRRLGLLLALLPLAGCVRPAEGRALKDLQIGRAEGGGLSVVVEEGLAAVRGLETGALTLWGNAPALRIRATAMAGAPEWWTLVVRNAMPDAVLSAEAGGEPLEVEEGPSLVPTVKTWRVRLPPSGEARLTVAPPDWESPRPFRFAALADVQEALPRVGDIYARMNEDPSLRFIVFSGDLTESGSREQLEEFQERLKDSRVPLYATLGNHETFTLDVQYQELVGRGSQHFSYQGVHFSLLDTGNGTVDPIVEEQLDGWLEEGRDAVHVVGMHIAPLDPVGVRNGSFSSRNEAAALVGKLSRAGVDVTLYGHVHSYYAYSNAGIPAYISGGGGAIPETFDGVGRHYLAVDVDPSSGVEEVAVVRVD
ncbi:metallophosphoesterase family protein [Hyalangium sp.]|uniref:metallophosphoesterase family protein n=1 Tax=Hyalangium sp. TaxID=2028555 RepID=UPI002D3F6C7E|nr:metallophosphoesterase [Hyalangium sp.]HYH97583.1 metallophosphoesterase [Hyalangium sp.]